MVSSRTTRRPDNEVSTMHAKQSRLQSSMTPTHAEPPAAGQCVRHEVEAPALVGLLRDRHRCPCSQRSFPATALAHRQPLFTIQPIHLSGSCPCPHAAAGSPAGDSRTGDARWQSRASAPGQHRPSREAAHIVTCSPGM